MGCQAEMQTLREEMQFLKTVHEQELEELRSLINADREEDEDHWREEMQKAIHDIQTEYDQRLEKIRKEMDINYSNRLAELSQAQAAQNSRFQKLTDENAALASDFEAMRKRAEQLRAKCDGLEEALKATQVENQTLRKNLENCQREAEREHRMTEDALNKALAELQALSDAKLNLESEIAAYRRLLEAQDSLFNDIGSSRKKNDPPPRPNGLRVRVPSYDSSPMSSTAPLSKSDIFVRWMDRDEPSGQSAKQQFIERKVEGEKFNTTRGGNAYFGQLTLNECSPKGHFIELSNTGNRDVELSRWCLIRNIDQGRRVTRYTLPARTVPPHTTFRIWAAGKMGTGNGRYDFEAPYTSWGTGELVHTSLYSPDGVETATYVQTADFSP
ncbi:unnamed protein product [Dicrocoelium dendriticum]|nr:unnamed protein product [Dicrocoelium dendriticum]